MSLRLLNAPELKPEPPSTLPTRRGEISNDLLHMHFVYDKPFPIEEFQVFAREVELSANPLINKIIDDGADILYDHYLDGKIPALVPKITMQVLTQMQNENNPPIDEDNQNTLAGFICDVEVVTHNLVHIPVNTFVGKGKSGYLGKVEIGE